MPKNNNIQPVDLVLNLTDKQMYSVRLCEHTWYKCTPPKECFVNVLERHIGKTYQKEKLG